MCKINGHSLFTYLVQPHNASKLLVSKENSAKLNKAQQQANEALANNSKGDEVSKTATTAKFNNNDKKSQSLSSLRVPLQSNSIGASVGGNTSLGLNLGG